MSACIGRNCDKKKECRLYYGNDDGCDVCFDYSTFGSGGQYVDKDGNSHSHCEFACGNAGGYKLFEQTDRIDED